MQNVLPYSEMMPDHKQGPVPPSNIVNQMIIYLDYGRKRILEWFYLQMIDCERKLSSNKQTDEKSCS
jgi:hypothetical protein